MLNALRGIADGLTRAEAAAIEVAADLAARGVHAAVCGGLAVAVYGYPRFTADVDLIVLEKERVAGAPLGIPGVTFRHNGVPVDVLFIEKHETFLREAILTAEKTPEGLPVLPFPALVYLKLKAGRMKDYADVVELLKVRGEAGAREIIHYLNRHAPHLRDRSARVFAAWKQEEGQ